jgi:hypothetical protein
MFGYQVLGFGSGGKKTYQIQFLVVAGGGAGGRATNYGGGGGGAGGFRTICSKTFCVAVGEAIPITVGSGGSQAGSTPVVDASGNNSIFSTITSAGGGGGGGRDNAPNAPYPSNNIGNSGGSGGGTAGTANTGGGGGGAGAGTPPQVPSPGAAAGASGGSGVVIIRRVTADSCGSGGSESTSGGDTIHIFNSPGTYTA